METKTLKKQASAAKKPKMARRTLHPEKFVVEFNGKKVTVKPHLVAQVKAFLAFTDSPAIEKLQWPEEI